MKRLFTLSALLLPAFFFKARIRYLQALLSGANKTLPNRPGIAFRPPN